MNGNVDHLEQIMKIPYFVLSRLVGKATCTTHRLCLYYYPKLSREPFSGPDGTWHSLDLLNSIKCARNEPPPSCCLGTTRSQGCLLSCAQALLWQRWLSQTKAFPETAQRVVDSHSPILDPCPEPVSFPRTDWARDDNGKNQTILPVTSGGLHFPRQLFI